jgi:hypothetical protein
MGKWTDGEACRVAVFTLMVKLLVGQFSSSPSPAATTTVVNVLGEPEEAVDDGAGADDEDDEEDEEDDDGTVSSCRSDGFSLQHSLDTEAMTCILYY